jgi:O-antigen/teichoic acid export membrane protein
MLLMITAAINIVMFPHFSSQKNLSKAKEDLVLVFKVNAYIIAAISLFMFLISAWLIPLFYGIEFSPSVLPFNILVLGTLFLSMAQVFGHFFGAMNKNWLNSILYSIVLFVLAGLSFLLVPNYGIIGGAWASTASYVLLFLLFTVMAARKFNIIPHSLFTIKNADIKRVKSLYKKFLKKK